jgi:fructose-1,6-bisphosphatase II
MAVSDPTLAGPRFGVDGEVVWQALAATRAAAAAAAAWSGRGDAAGADGAATDAMRAAFASARRGGEVVTGEGAKDGAPMLADGEHVGTGGVEFDLAVDPLECTDLCARGLPGALATVAVAPKGSMWSPGPGYYMDKLVVPPAAVGAATITDPPEVTLANVADALGRQVRDLRVVVLDKPRHVDLIARLRATGASVSTPTAGDVAGALEVLLPAGRADLLLGIGGTPEGVLAACAVRALGGGMQGRLAPQREDERVAVERAGFSTTHVLELHELITAEATFIATGVTGGLLRAARVRHGWLETESIVVAGGAIHRISTESEE